MGPGRVRPGASGEQADLPVGRLLDVPLVPRDGARELREPCDCRGALPLLRLDQGRSRRAPGRGPRLHDVRPGHDRIRRVADERLAHANVSSRSTAGHISHPRHDGDDRASSRFSKRSRESGARSRRRSSSRRRRSWDAFRACARLAEPGAVPDAGVLDRTVAEFASSFDPRRGGFGGAPKFPRPSELLFLLREHARTGVANARDMVLVTLRAMALGGMRDHLGGGFHRYSVDADWRVPHFEKMLYDQAQLVLAFAEAAQITGDRFYADVALDTLDYVRRDLTSPGGGFFSAEDADSVPPEHAHEPRPHKMEGAFYIWRDDEIQDVLGDDAAVFRARLRHPAGWQRAEPIPRASSRRRTCSTRPDRSTMSRR